MPQQQIFRLTPSASLLLWSGLRCAIERARADAAYHALNRQRVGRALEQTLLR